MNKKLRPLLLLTLPFLASCGGYSLSYIVEGNKYISYNFTENYYTHWDEELKNAQEVASIDVNDKSITSFSEIGKLDPQYLVDTVSEYEYARVNNLMRADQSFYYGVQSKLFDGEIVCGGYYQKRRVQTNPSGFSVRFSKESDELSYFALQFKVTTNNQLDCYPVGKLLPSYAGVVGENGDLYVDGKSWQYYIKQEGMWKRGEGNLNCTFANAEAYAYYGAGAPGADLGEENSFYIDTSNYSYYTKDSGTWTAKGSLTTGLRSNPNIYICYGNPYNSGDMSNPHDTAIYHNSSFDLNVTVYTKENSKIVGRKFYRHMTIDSNNTNNGSYYIFYGFDLKEYDLSRMVGFSITFDNLDDELITWNTNKKIGETPVTEIDYAMFAYEVFIPHTYWH